MSTKMIARGIVGSLRLVGVTTAVAAGIAGFVTVGAGPAAAVDHSAQFQVDGTQQPQTSTAFGKRDLPKTKVPAKACGQMMEADVPGEVIVKLGCIVIDGPGEVVGVPIFS